MKFKKIFAAAAACAVATLSAASYAATTVSAATVVGKAMLSGQMGTYSQWKEEDAIANGSTVANIDGNAQYEATWNITGDGTGSIEFLILQISGSDSSSEDYKNFTADQYPDLKITVDEVYIDGVKAPYTSSADSIDYKYYEADLGKARIYLTSTWEQPKLCQDLSPQTEVKQQIKVVFTVSGLYNDGTSNVTNNSSGGNNTTPTQAPSENNNQPTQANNGNNQTTQAQNNNTSGGTSGGAVLGNSTQTTSASTGHAGVAAAVAGLVITTGIGITAVALRRKK